MGCGGRPAPGLGAPDGGGGGGGPLLRVLELEGLALGVNEGVEFYRGTELAQSVLLVLNIFVLNG